MSFLGSVLSGSGKQGRKPANALITEADFSEVSRELINAQITLKFNVDGTEYHVKTKKQISAASLAVYEVGVSRKIFYVPDNPQDIKLFG